jgi:hypothetical protein
MYDKKLRKKAERLDFHNRGLDLRNTTMDNYSVANH